MRVLWTVNLIPSTVAEKKKIDGTVLGGWVESMLEQLRGYPDLQLAVACKTEGAEVFSENIDGVQYYSLNYTKKNTKETLTQRCREIIEDFAPDLIQIEGTEFLHADVMQTVGREMRIKTVISLQGILNGQYGYQCGQLQMDDLMWSLSWTKIVTGWVLHLRKVLWFRPRLKHERKVLENAQAIIGRTTWDQAHAYALNPNAKYYTCNRVLRKPFYQHQWKIDGMERHSIYVGNGYHALKGVHFMLEAMPQILREYPDAHLYVAGYRPYQEHDRRPFYKKGYGAYLKKLIHDLKLKNAVTFMGPLKADAVAQRLSKSHAYVLASTIENSPNTLGEAMMVGTPCVAAYVGGVSDMSVDGKEALFFRNDDPALLAWRVKQIFDSDEFACQLSENAKVHARITHDPKINARQLYNIYCDRLKESEG